MECNREDYLQWCEAILDANHRNLSKWEKEFTESIKEQLDTNVFNKLSPRQIEILERIYSERT